MTLTISLQYAKLNAVSSSFIFSYWLDYNMVKFSRTNTKTVK